MRSALLFSEDWTVEFVPLDENDAGPLERLLGPFASVRILDFLSTFREFDYSIADTAENTGLSRKTVERELPRLVEYGVVEKSRTVGRAQMHRLGSTPVALKLNALISEIARFDSDRLVREAEVPATVKAEAEKITATA